MADVLLVEDEKNLRSLFRDVLTEAGHAVQEAATLADARAALERRLPDVLVLDVRLPDGEGLALLEHRVPAVVTTAFGTVERAVSALKAGAVDFLVKPFEHARLLAAVEQAVRVGADWEEVELTRGEVQPAPSLPSLVGAQGGLRPVAELLPRIAATDATVLITGESGTGKELVARAVHQASPRRDGPFQALNCAALPATLVESELFGFERGAFTGAHARKLGLIEAAAQGTLFLDEIGDLPLEAQAKLLRVLQERELVRVGGTARVAVDVRVIAATHRDLAALAASGGFREDLRYRLTVVPVHLPPLRERLQDLSALVSHFVARHAARHRLPPPTPSPEAWAWMRQHPWPGNVRELENWVERSVVLQRFDAPAQAAAPSPATAPAASAPHPDARVRPLRETLAEAERAALIAALEATQGNKAEAARQLGVSYKTLFNKLHEHGIHERHRWE